MRVTLSFIKIDSQEIIDTSILNFDFKKDAYTPYTYLSASFVADNENYISICESKLYIDNKLVHHGLIDSIEIVEENGVKKGKLISRGFTSLLTQNQMASGIMSNISINSLMDNFYPLSYITHEDNSNTENYIYVHDDSYMWDGIVTLAYKFCGKYPYIEGTNCVRITEKSNPKAYSYTNNDIISYGLLHDYSNVCSHYNMPDIEGNYNNFSFANQDIIDYKIIRHKFNSVDKEFLYDPMQAAIFRSYLRNKARFLYYCEYNGYNGEDLSDLVSFRDVISRRINLVNISGTNTGVTTKIGVYYDDFFAQ